MLKKKLYGVFDNLEEAYNEVNILELWNILHRYEVENWLLDMIRMKAK